MANRRQRKKNLKRLLQGFDRLREQMEGFDMRVVEAIGARDVWKRLQASLNQIDTWRVMALWREGQR